MNGLGAALFSNLRGICVVAGVESGVPLSLGIFQSQAGGQVCILLLAR